ncbi:hypothetical protein PQR63_23235 [Herbaspirillum rhizosphaerae]|uniref:PRTase-CE domain-containing protein n=1 Tax=Herbaspirillum rhizosphaerae TaxID=346179 RepID=A0ABW8ZFI8_9BURK
MNDEWQFTTPFLRGLAPHTRGELRNRRELWNIAVDDFYPRIEAWFGNFEAGDQLLALKLLLKLQYYSEKDLERYISHSLLPIQQYLFKSGGTLEDLRLVLPPNLGDSADRHAYEILKSWMLNQNQIVRVDQLANVDRGCVLVFFNDTHGTGNQFLREVFSQVRKEDFKAIFVVAVTIAERALLRFQRELEGVKVLPDVPAPSIFDEFTAREVNRLRELGSQVYPKHPFGYGNAGLLVAYHFQCPNNTLPLIWASHEGGNNIVGGKPYPWRPLFAYRPKAKVEQPQATEPASQATPDTSILKDGNDWSDVQLKAVVDHIAGWGLATPAFYQTVCAWFGNFRPEERAAALKIFLTTSYLDIGEVRTLIRDFRTELMAELGRVGGDLGDVILVTTGDEKNSVYHYMYEFIREWHLSIDQVCSLERLSPDQVIDKTLVFFYHTRASGQHFETYHAKRLSELRPRANVFAAYAMSCAAQARFRELRTGAPNRVLYSENVSRTVSNLGADTCETISRIERQLRPNAPVMNPEQTFLSAYYFQCPIDTSSLLWCSQDASEKQRAWAPLFHRISMPSNTIG